MVNYCSVDSTKRLHPLEGSRWRRSDLRAVGNKEGSEPNGYLLKVAKAMAAAKYKGKDWHELEGAVGFEPQMHSLAVSG